jgi:uncharacterized membrane protein
VTLAVATYQAYLLLHVVAAVVWLGGGLTLSILGTRIAKQRDASRMVAFAKDAEWVGSHVFIPASLLVLLFGFLMIEEGPASFGEFWIQLALGLFGATFLTGSLFLGPQAGKIAKLIERLGENAPEVQQQIRRVLLISRLDLLTLYSVVVVMVAKPTTDDGLLFTVWAIVLALAAAAVVVDHRRDSAGVPDRAPVLAEE